MTPPHIATLALETWRASGPRTTERLAELVEHYNRAYYGDRRALSLDQTGQLSSAHDLARRSVRSWEVLQ